MEDEPINEISKSTARSYVSAAMNDAPPEKWFKNYLDRKIAKRLKGIRTATSKAVGSGVKVAATNEERAWDPDTRTERDVDHYKIVHRDGTVVGKATTKKGATRSQDMHDNRYGAYVHKIKTVFKEEAIEHDFNALTISEDGAQLHPIHVVKVHYSEPTENNFDSRGSTPSKIYSRNVNVSARDKTHALNKVGVELSQKKLKIHLLKYSGLKESISEETKFAPKKLRDIIAKPAKRTHEYKGNTPDERAIVARYDDNTVEHPDRNGNGDDVFKASKIKRDDKKVVPGDDEKKYDEWNKGSSENCSKR